MFRGPRGGSVRSLRVHSLLASGRMGLRRLVANEVVGPLNGQQNLVELSADAPLGDAVRQVPQGPLEAAQRPIQGDFWILLHVRRMTEPSKLCAWLFLHRMAQHRTGDVSFLVTGVVHFRADPRPRAMTGRRDRRLAPVSATKISTVQEA